MFPGIISIEGTAISTVKIRLVEMRVDQDEWVACSGSLIWSCQVGLSEGTYTIKIRIVDTSWSEATQNVEIKINKENPANEKTLDDGDGLTQHRHWLLFSILIALAIGLIIVIVGTWRIRKNLNDRKIKKKGKKNAEAENDKTT